MMRAVIQVVVNAVGLLAAAWLVPGVDYTGGVLYLLLAGLVIGLVNLLVKPLVSLLSLPLILLTLGLFYLVINGAMFWLAGWLLGGLHVDGCLPAILGGLVLALVNWLVRAFRED
ncbi:MAG TPA: phage holin family protein [Thermoanaerobaculia bacterium]|nr:phage holin family protein [Thermoanaerobaculia bacterium]